MAGLFWSFAFIYFYCELGQRVSNSFAEIADKIEIFRWYAFPLKVQRMLPIILSVAQREVMVQGYGNLACARIVFKQVNALSIDFKLIIYIYSDNSIQSLSGSACFIFIFYGST